MFDNVVIGVEGYPAGQDALALARALLAREGRATLVYVEVLQSDGTQTRSPVPTPNARRLGLKRLRRLGDKRA